MESSALVAPRRHALPGRRRRESESPSVSERSVVTCGAGPAPLIIVPILGAAAAVGSAVKGGQSLLRRQRLRRDAEAQKLALAELRAEAERCRASELEAALEERAFAEREAAARFAADTARLRREKAEALQELLRETGA